MEYIAFDAHKHLIPWRMRS